MKLGASLLLSVGMSAPVWALDTAKFHDEFAALLQKEQVVGAQLVLFDRAGISHSWNFGEAAPGKAVTDQTLFRAGSTTKTLTALAVMQLVAQHKLALHDEVLALEPALQLDNPYQAQQPVQVIHLLEHTAGLDDMHFRNFYNEHDGNIDLLAAVNRDSAALKVRWLPGTRHAYSNPGYGILGHLVARYSGEPFEQYVTDHLLKPLQMQQCQLVADTAEPAGLSQGYDGAQALPYRQIYLRSAGNLVCNAQGLAHMARFLMTQGQSATVPDISASTITQMETPETTLAAKHGLRYGYGKAIYHATRGGREWLGHNGGIDGFTTSYAYSRELGVGYALMVNSSSANFSELTKAIAKALADNQTAAVVAAKPAGQQAPVSGYYRIANERNEIFAGLSAPFAVVKLTSTADSLTLSPLLGTDELYRSMGEGLYAHQDRSFATGVSMPTAASGPAFDMDGQFFLQVSAYSAWGQFLLMMAGFVSVLMALAYMPVWGFNRYRGLIATGGDTWLRSAPLVYSAMVGLGLLATMQQSLYSLSQLNWQNIILTTCSALLPVIVLWQWWTCWRYATKAHGRFARVFAWFAAMANTGLTIYLATCGYIGLRLWQW